MAHKFLLRIPKDLFMALRTAAFREEVSINALVIRILTQWQEATDGK